MATNDLTTSETLGAAIAAGILAVGESVTDQLFFTGDGVTNVARLTIDGVPCTSPTVTAMHQTDWQGRVALSNQPRTNYLTHSDFDSMGSWQPYGTAKPTATIVNGAGVNGRNAIRVDVTGVTSDNGLQMTVAEVKAGGVWTLRSWLKNLGTSAALVRLRIFDTRGNFVSVPADGAYHEYTFTATLLPNTGGFVRPLEFGTGGSTQGSLLVSAVQLEAGDSVGAYIPTTSAPVTLTDYAVDAVGGVVLGQSPAVDATLDWDGYAKPGKTMSGTATLGTATMAAQAQLTTHARNQWTPQVSGADITTFWGVANIRGDWQVSGGALASGDDLTTAVLISLFTDRRANDDDVLPDASNDRRGWWGDLDQDVPIGSRLWLLARSKLMPSVALAAKGYITEALRWMVDDGVAAAVDIVASIVMPNRLNAVVTITRATGTKQSLQFNWAWNALT